MLLPRVFASSIALAASLRSRVVTTTCSAANMGSMPSPVLDEKGAVLNAEALAGKRVALYFSAGWCPMCTSIEPAMMTFLQACEDSGKPISLIYVPSDRNQADAQSRAQGLNALQVPFDQADEYKKQFKIWAGSECMRLGLGRRSGVPALVVLGSDCKELAFLPAEAQGVRALQQWPLDDPRGVWP